MPRAPKICSASGCIALTESSGDSYCPEHKAASTQRFSRANPGSRARTTTPGHRKRREKTLARAGNRCAAPYPDICTGVASVYDHHIGVKLYDCLPPKIRAKLTHETLDMAEWNAAALCEKCSRRKSSQEGHWAAGHSVPCPYDLSIIPDYVLNGSPPPPTQSALPRSIDIIPPNDDGSRSPTEEDGDQH